MDSTSGTNFSGPRGFDAPNDFNFLEYQVFKALKQLADVQCFIFFHIIYNLDFKHFEPSWPYVYLQWCIAAFVKQTSSMSHWIDIQQFPSFKCRKVDPFHSNFTKLTQENLGETFFGYKFPDKKVKKSCTSWYGEYLVLYRVLYIPGGAGFLPSTVPINVPLFFFCGGERNEEEVNPAKFQCLNLKL